MLALALLILATFVPTLQPGDAVPAIPLVDQSGEAFSFPSLRGKVVIVAFIFTRCGDARMCPLVSAKFARMQRVIGTQPIRLVALTLDPAFDTPAVLRRYGAAYGQDGRRWMLGTGNADDLAELATRFGIATGRTQAGQLLHTEAVVVIDGEGRVARVVDGNSWVPEEMLALARNVYHPSPRGVLATIRLWLTDALARCGGGTASFNVLAVLAVLAATTAALAFTFLRSLGS